MQTIIVKNGQTFIDLAMQYAGSAEAALAMSVQNNLPLTAELTTGSVQQRPSVLNAVVAKEFEKEKANPQSNISGVLNMNEGIGYWYLENDFIVS